MLPTTRRSRRRLSSNATGQHEAAARGNQGAHPEAHADKPAVWGYYAQFLYNAGSPAGEGRGSGRAGGPPAQAHRTSEWPISCAGQFRENEGELIGSLLLYRKAAEGYDPEAHDALTNVYLKIYQHETLLNRPVAARGRARTGRPFPAGRSRHPRPARRRIRRGGPAPRTGPEEIHVPPHRQARRHATWPRANSRRRPRAFEQLTAPHPR